MEHTWFIIFLSIPSRYPRQTTGDGEVLTGAVCSGNHNIHSQTPPPLVPSFQATKIRRNEKETKRERGSEKETMAAVTAGDVDGSGGTGRFPATQQRRQ
ncbi:hypothetical protein HanXRQr2_Chr13g0572611 [Helianthus annuus]|uniref:Uncharacterized protein n=1 Tax=Helianthus annuus TaxID=4232 RepID=A0A251SQR1_HELAN|nr:hypothetical protein HanXRQr2_Chr13g0572611 [Helianthus annuus]